MCNIHKVTDLAAIRGRFLSQCEVMSKTLQLQSCPLKTDPYMVKGFLPNKAMRRKTGQQQKTLGLPYHGTP